ncbi:MAG: choice-of-anchor D domain-containing protein [bacterium]|nr:choice-of-anchor D domain-containing protein [bacterium]
MNNQSTVYIRLVQTTTTSINGGTVATAGTGRVDNFTVTSGIVGLPFSQDFNAGVNSLAYWGGNMNVTTNHGTLGSNGLNRNLYSGVTTAFALSPQIGIGPLTATSQLEFDYRIVDYTGYPSTATIIGASDIYNIQVSTDGGLTFTTVYTINSANHVVTTNFAKVIIPLGAYAGSNAVVKWNLQWGAGDYYFDIDNVFLREPPAGPPAPAVLVSPLNGATNILLTATLNWASGGGTPETGYYINFGTDNPPTNILNNYDNGLNTSYTPGSPLAYNTTYYWEIIPYNGSGNATGTVVWSFTTLVDPTVYSYPFVEGFEAGNTDQTAIVGWTQEAVTGTSIWTANSSLTTYNRTPRTGTWNAYLRYGNERWMFKPFQLTGGTSYTFEMYARQDGATSTNSNMTVSYGDAPNAAAMTNPIVATTGIINGDYQRLFGTFTPSTTGVYYIGIKGYMNSTPWYISLDDISVFLTPAVPVFSIDPTSKAFGEVQINTSSANQTFTISNTGVGTLTITAGNISIVGTDASQFVLTDGNTYPIELGTGETATVDVNFSPTTVGAKTASLQIVDNTALDATHTVPLTGTGVDATITTLPYTQNFDGVTAPALPLGWTVENTNADAVLWVNSTSAPRSTPNSMRISYNASLAMDDWFFSPPIQLTGGVTYRVNFWYRASGFTESMEVMWGSAPTSAGMTEGPIFDNPAFSFSTYTEGSGMFTPTTTGTYFIGWHGYSAADQYYICVDDVTVDEATYGNLNGLVTNAFTTNPLVGATVTAGPYSTTTNASGNYEFLNILTGTYNVTASKYGYASTTVTGVIVTDGATTTQNIALDELLFPATNLEAAVTGDDVQLTWNAPPNVVLQWDDGVNYASIGVNGPLVFDVAHRWPVADLTDLGVDGKYLKVVYFFPAQVAATYTIKVWQGANAGSLTEVYSQAVTSPTINAWNEVNLTTPVEIDGTQELWIGYNINTTTGYPAGCDATLEYPGKGNMIYSTDFGGAWVELTALNPALTYDWNIAGYVYNTLTDGEESVIALAKNSEEKSPIVNKEKPDLSNGILLQTGSTNNNRSDVESKLVHNRSGAIDATLLGYDVYKDDILVADNTTNLFYNDNNLPLGVYSYEVVAVYSEGEAAPAGPVVVQIVPTPGTIPFTEDFEGSWPGLWTVVNGAQTNQWFVGTAALPYAGTKSAYISNDGGTTYAYTNTASSVVHLYRDITFSGGSGGYELKFWYKGIAEPGWDFLKVYVVDTDVIPVEAVQLPALNQVGTEYNNQLDYVEATILLPSSLTGSTKRLVFSWRNDGVDGEQPPISFDNISLVGLALIDAEVTSIERPNLTENLDAVFNPSVTITNNSDAAQDIPVYAEIWTSEGTFFRNTIEDPKPVAENISKETKSLNGIEITNRSNYTPPTLSPDATILSEDFEGGVVPPTGWTLESQNTSFTWYIDNASFHSGLYGMTVDYDPALVPQDEILVSPVIDLSSYTGQTIKLSFWWLTSYYWMVNPYDNGDFTVDISTDGGATWPTNLFNEDAVGTFTSWVWYDANLGTHIDLSTYAGQSNVKLRFRYLAVDAAQCSVDDILIYTEYTPVLVYSDNVTVTGLGSGASQVVNFDPWTATPEGNYTFKAYTDLIGDLVPANDILNREFVVVGSTTFQLSVNLLNGWNMVSIPGLHPVDQNVGTWWAYRVAGSQVFKYQGGYTQVTTATPGEGYWMKQDGARLYNTGDEWPSGGIQIVAHAPLAGNSGWNMIGGYELSVTAANVTTVPGGLQSGPIFKYSGGYTAATTIDPGFGYWIKLTGAGQIIIPETMAKESRPVEYFAEDWGRIILTDAAGVSYTLYAVKGEVDLSQYELPPAPPAGMYDFRFTSGRIAEDINSAVQTIEMSGVVYPLTVKVEGMDIRLMDESGKMLNTNLKSGEDVVISDATIQKLKVSGELLPTVYSLEQNYPNPFNPSTVIEFSLPEDVASVKLSIYNALGEKVAELVNTSLQAGRYQYQWNAGSVATGMYIYELRTDKFVSVKKMLLLK